MSGKQKLELTWIGRKAAQAAVVHSAGDISLSYHAKHQVSDNDSFDNRLIFGDKLLTLKVLEQEFTGEVCVHRNSCKKPKLLKKGS